MLEKPFRSKCTFQKEKEKNFLSLTLTIMPPKKSIQKTSNRVPTKGPSKVSKNNKKSNTNTAQGQKKKTKDQKV